MKWLMTFFLWLCPAVLMAQHAKFEAVIVDARTHEPLSFASVFSKKGNSTITNMVGRFSIEADSADVLHISYVGYKPLSIQAGSMHGRVELSAMEMGLQEVTVEPISNLIRKTTKETLKQLQKHKRKETNFFYRQTAFKDSVCYELAEAFLSGHSAAWLRDLKLVTGRFAGIQPDSLHYYSFYSNFYTFSMIEIASKQKQQFGGLVHLLPLSRDYANYYDVDYEVIRDGDSRLFAIHFTPKPHVRQSVLDVTLYVDESTYLVRKVEGVGRYFGIVHTDRKMVNGKVRLARTKYLTDFNLVVNLTDERGFLEVQSVFIDECHEFYGNQITTRSILYNVGDRKLGKGERMDFYGVLQNQIEEQGYDASFWRNNEIVQRTPVEQQVMELFERNNLFGVFN